MEVDDSTARGVWRRHRTRRLPVRESGAIAIMFAGALIIIIAFFALALDISRVHNRKMELQNLADSAALAAANELDGTEQGIQRALDAVTTVMSFTDWKASYQYGMKTAGPLDRAIAFGSGPGGPWRNAVEAKADAGELLFVKVDTRDLDADYGEVKASFLHVFADSDIATSSARAIAGRSAISVTPLGICAMRDEARRDHNGELEEFGFRRGISYNLLDLNRPGSTAGQSFTVNPLPGTAPITNVDTLAPFVCTGTMAMSRLTSGKVVVSSSFPISSLYYHLNSRFGSYSTTPRVQCDARTAPADANIKEYTYDGGSPWMSVQPEGQAAKRLETTERRWTIAGPDSAPTGTTAAHWGPLWSYAKAVKYESYEDLGDPEPAGGYATFDTTAWETLYAGKPKPSTTTPYPSDAATPTPYSYKSGSTFYRAPATSNKSIRGRRVLNLPLLACPVTDNKASVLGIGKFFMTRTATATSLYGEFAGLVPEQTLGTQVELYHDNN